MIELIQWLIENEHAATEIYEKAAIFMEADKDFAGLLNRLAQDEAMHYHFMNSALICMNQYPQIKSEITLDDQTKKQIEKPLKKIQDAFGSGRLTKDLIIEYIFTAEQSEWNDIFLYVVNKLKTHCRQFKYAVPSIQHHLRYIEKYFEKIPEYAELTEKIKQLTPVWNEKILVVDDSEPILELVQAILSKEGEVHTAENGADGLQKAGSDYYAVIISDIEMPLMNGIEFFEKMEPRYLDVGKRFLFISGGLTKENDDYIKRKNLNFLPKPFTISDLKQRVFNIMEKITV